MVNACFELVCLVFLDCELLWWVVQVVITIELGF